MPNANPHAPTKKSRTQPDIGARIFQRPGSRRYYVDLRDLGGGRPALVPAGETYGTTDPVIAHDLAAQRVHELRKARLTGQQLQHFAGMTRQMPVREGARAWYSDRLALCDNAPRTGGPKYTSPRTLRRYGQALTQLFRVHDPDAAMASVTVGQVRAALRALRKLPSKTAARRKVGTALRQRAGETENVVPTLSPASLRQVIAAMQLVYDYAADEGWVPPGYNPWRALRKADRPRLAKGSSTDFLEVYEGHAMLEACTQVSDCELPLRPIVAALLLTGGRRDEVLGLEVTDIDFGRQTVRFQSNDWRDIKTGDERTLPLWPQLERELREYRARTGRMAGLLFPSPRGRGSDRMITGLSRRIAQVATIASSILRERYGAAAAALFDRKVVNPRSFRPTYCAARLQTTEQGRPVAQWTVQGDMGHSSAIMIQKVYGRLGQVRHRSEVVEYVPRERAEVEAALGAPPCSTPSESAIL